MNKLIVTIIGQDCQQTLDMCLESVMEADKIIYLDGGSEDNSINRARAFCAEVLENTFDKSNPNMISIQRNFYLDYLKKNHKGDWCLVLDADEVLDTNGIAKLKVLTKELEVGGAYSPKMRHLMYTLGFEDVSQKEHFVHNRFFKISDAQKYQDGEHCLLIADNQNMCIIPSVTIWHLGYLGGAWDVKKRYDQQILRDSGHTKDFLNNWNKTHMLGNYPLGKVDLVELPDIILNNFGLDKDELYFEGRGLETKHFIDALHWKKFFNCKTAIEFGCGMGPRLFAMDCLGINPYGVEISKYAVKNSIYSKRVEGSILDFNEPVGNFDLSIAYDVLEHINYVDLDNAINTLITFSDKHILVSIPFIGDPNLENDPTHIIKETKEWWVKQFTDKGLKEVEVPEHFLFKEQLLIFEK